MLQHLLSPSGLPGSFQTLYRKINNILLKVLIYDFIPVFIKKNIKLLDYYFFRRSNKSLKFQFSKSM